MRKLRGVIMGALLIMVLSSAVSAQTLGTKVPGADEMRETWELTIAASDSISSYFIVPYNTESIMIHFPPLTGTIVVFQCALDSSRVAGGRINTGFKPIRVNTTARDSILSTAGDFNFNATDILKGVQAARIRTVTAQAAAVTVRVYIRKRPRGL